MTVTNCVHILTFFGLAPLTTSLVWFGNFNNFDLGPIKTLRITFVPELCILHHETTESIFQVLKYSECGVRVHVTTRGQDRFPFRLLTNISVLVQLAVDNTFGQK